MQLLTSLFFDGLRIGLQGLNLVCVALVVVLQRSDFALEIDVLGAFLPVNHHSIGAEHYVREEPDREHRNRNGREPASGFVGSQKPRTQFRANSPRDHFHLRGLIGDCLSSSLYERDTGTLRNSLYSNIHFLAAVLNFSSASGLAASE